jgi:uncharacterized damage-inducible protein DinB
MNYMTHLEFLSSHIGEAITGPVWHAQSLDELLADVTAEEAGTRPIPDAHSIAELVAHMGVWAAEAERRLSGATGSPSEAENFPQVDTSSDAAWQAVLQQLREQHKSLERATQKIDEVLLHVKLPNRRHTRAVMLHGVVEHDAYHAGQIALLKKLIRSRKGS